MLAFNINTHTTYHMLSILQASYDHTICTLLLQTRSIHVHVRRFAWFRTLPTYIHTYTHTHTCTYSRMHTHITLHTYTHPHCIIIAESYNYLDACCCRQHYNCWTRITVLPKYSKVSCQRYPSTKQHDYGYFRPVDTTIYCIHC